MSALFKTVAEAPDSEEVRFPSPPLASKSRLNGVREVFTERMSDVGDAPAREVSRSS